MTDTQTTFSQMYEALMGFEPYPWQQRLYARMMAGDWPAALDIPTGLGKTSVMAIWLIALAAGGDVPRRLVYVVNRRTIVDQASEQARRMLGLLYRSGQRDGKPWATEQAIARLGLLDTPPLEEDRAEIAAELRDALTKLSGASGDETEPPLAVSTLRGELADNGEWRSNPARPAIIVGTVDLIGSDLLFRGYRTSWRSRSFQAGLLGQDAMIVHDEAHLTQPFQTLVDEVVGRQAQGKEKQLRPLRSMALSATAVNEHEADAPTDETRIHRLSQADLSDPGVAERLNATKHLFLHESEKLVDTLVERALGYSDQRVKVVVYVRSPEDAGKVAKKLRSALKKSADDRLALLTGAIRGRERDQLLTRSAMKYFLAGADTEPWPDGIEGAVYLVSTSAGEVGVDLDADHMVGDLSPADSLVQRLGRVNRRGGEGRTADVHVHVETSSKGDTPYEKACAATAAMLRTLGAGPATPIDASPWATRSWKMDDARAPTPETLPLTEAGLDALSLTSIAEPWPVVPDVASLLHGLVDDLPQTVVLWRRELEVLHTPERVTDEATLQQIFRKYPPLSRERLTVRTDRLVAFLKDRAKQRAKDQEKAGAPANALHAVIVGQEAKWQSLDTEAVQAEELEKALRFKTLVLPTAFGGLDAAGMLDAKAESPTEGSLDVADEIDDRFRVRMNGDDGERLLVNGGEPPRDRGRLVFTVALDEKQRNVLRFYRKVDRPDRGSTPTDPPTVQRHNEAVRDLAERYADALRLEPAVKQALMDAGAAHDLGKRRAMWQSAIHNNDPTIAFAKSKPKVAMRWRDLQRYRHELGSLLDADTRDDLTLHLIASHHGRARPHFREPMFDPDRPLSACPDPAEIACRFARLQRQYGHWGLAWLEALLRAADRAASNDATAEEDDK